MSLLIGRMWKGEGGGGGRGFCKHKQKRLEACVRFCSSYAKFVFLIFNYLLFSKMSGNSFSNDNRLPKKVVKAAKTLQAIKEKKESLNNLIYSEDNAHVVSCF